MHVASHKPVFQMKQDVNYGGEKPAAELCGADAGDLILLCLAIFTGLNSIDFEIVGRSGSWK